MITISQLDVHREGNSICSVESLSIPSAGRIGVLGANGSGKTTLLRVMAGLTDEFSGRCQVETDHLQRTFVHQHPFLFRGTVLSNICYGLRCRHRNKRAATDQAMHWLKRLDIEHLANRTTYKLSGGEIRRVALARALAFEPQLLLLDEPLAELDPQATETVCAILCELKNTTLVIASPTPLPEGLVQNDYRL